MPDVPSPGADLCPAPFTHKQLEVNGLRLHYLDYGGAGKRPMLCLHGGGLCRFGLRRLCRESCTVE